MVGVPFATPILHGRCSDRNPMARDKQRKDFAAWLLVELEARGDVRRAAALTDPVSAGRLCYELDLGA